MRNRILAISVVGAISLQGCTPFQIQHSDSLYLAQNYLPVPQDLPNTSRLDIIAAAESNTSAGCSEVNPLPRGDRSNQNLLLLPGMTLRVAETSYRRDEADAAPGLAEWRWRLPAPAGCSGGDAGWTRRDILMVRHLLSGARIPKEAATSDTTYYTKLAQRTACASGGPTCSFDALRRGMLDPFVSGLSIAYRDANQPGIEDERAVQVPEAAKMGTSGGKPLAQWFVALTAERDADFFQSPAVSQTGNTGSSIADYCSKLPADRVIAAPQTADGISTLVHKPLEDLAVNGQVGQVTWKDYRDRLHATRPGQKPGGPPRSGVPDSVVSPACNFSLKTLALDVPPAWRTADGAAPPLFPAQLSLISSGDGLFLFRPLAFKAMLDTSDRWLCPQEGGAPDSADRSICAEQDRLSQGFLEFEPVFTVMIAGTEAPVEVGPDMTLAAFEARYGEGRTLRTVDRRALWLPGEITLVDPNHPEKTKRLAASQFVRQGRARLQVAVGTSLSGTDHGLGIPQAMKTEILLAPGDIISFSGHAAR